MGDADAKAARAAMPVMPIGPTLSRAVATIALLGLLAGCAATRPPLASSTPSSIAGSDDGASSQNAPSINPQGSVDSKRIAEEGLKYLRAGDSEKAARLFNAAIKFDSENGTYHLLAGIAYHLEFRKTSAPAMLENAEIGYKLGAKFNPGDVRANIQLGRLYLDAKSLSQARDAFATALEANPGDVEALYGMATASYLLGDIKLALWAVRELELQHYDAAAIARMRAVFYTAIGETKKAEQNRAVYAAAASSQPDIGSLDERLAQIQAMVDKQGWLTDPATPPSQAFALAAGSDTGTAASAQLAPPAAAPNAGAVPPLAADTRLPVEPWWVCPGGMGGGGMMGGSMGGGGMPSGSGDETVQLPAIPAPCPTAKAPKMAIIDVVMLRTEDSISHSFGSNLLQNLTGYFGIFASMSGSTTSPGSLIGSGSTSTTLALGGPMSANSALAYSLNIANATQNRNEVLARPTLLAIDRLPSTFFSGANISIVVGGASPGANSMLVDKQVGVSFSVTPTFVDDDNVLLTIKTARSFVTTPATGTIGVALSQSRLATSANLMVKPGQTVILSGLAERERVKGKAGVPVLRDIPGVQFLFSNDQTSDYFRTVMVMLTMRKPVLSEEDVAGVEAEKNARKVTGMPQVKKYGFYWRVDEYANFLSKSAPNMDAAIDTLNNNKLYLNFKGKDLDASDWATKSRMQNMTDDFMKYFIR